jgi:hypothetical protein
MQTKESLWKGKNLKHNKLPAIWGHLRQLNPYYPKHNSVEMDSLHKEFLQRKNVTLNEGFRIWCEDIGWKKDIQKVRSKRKRMRHSRDSVNRKNASGLGREMPSSATAVPSTLHGILNSKS